MTTAIDIKKEIVRLLRESFPDFKVYSKIVSKGYTRPCFFVDLQLLDSESQSCNAIKYTYGCYITIMADMQETERLKAVETIKSMLRGYRGKYILHVGDRFLLVEGLHLVYTGENYDVPEVDFDVTLIDDEHIEEDYDTMEDVEVEGTVNDGPFTLEIDNKGE